MEFLTRNPRMGELLEQASRLGKSEHPILLQGESGSGKERLAAYIHAHSNRATGPFVKVDCTTLPEALWESALFGRARGVASGEDAVGKFDLARGGTLFFDEVTEVPLPVQTKLLRVLQEKVFEPVGLAETRRADVRVIAATNRDISRLKETGHFREDLYFRLNVLTLTLPALRDRKEDIELLADQILARQVKTGGVPLKLTADAVSAILLYQWPGNVRELENALHRAQLVAGPRGPIDVRHLPPEVSAILQPPPPRATLKRYIRSAELLLIRWSLAICGNDRSKAAKYLGISRAALYKKMKLYPEFRQGGEEGPWAANVVRSTAWVAEGGPAPQESWEEAFDEEDDEEPSEDVHQDRRVLVAIQDMAARIRSLEQRVEVQNQGMQEDQQTERNLTAFGMVVVKQWREEETSKELLVGFSVDDFALVRRLVELRSSLLVYVEEIKVVLGVVTARAATIAHGADSTGGLGVQLAAEWSVLPRVGLSLRVLGLERLEPVQRQFYPLSQAEVERGASLLESQPDHRVLKAVITQQNLRT